MELGTHDLVGRARLNSNDPVPLWRQLGAATDVVAAVHAGRSSTAALEGMEPALRPAAQALSFHALRQLGRARALRQALVERKPPARADALLCTALALCWREEDAPYAPHVLVDQAVESARRHRGSVRQAGLINACLRRFLRERETLVRLTDPDPEARWNHPRWWIEQLRSDWPANWEAVLAAANAHPPLALRVNPRRMTTVRYLDLLSQHGIQAQSAGDSGVVLDRPLPVARIPGFSDGWVSVQDVAAQLAAPLLLRGRQTLSPLRILDACAAPGGKTAHLLELADAQVLALDIDPVRCGRIGDTLKRLALRASVRVGDAAQPASWWDGRPFDAILLDAPCTASGTVRRHPDVRWLRRRTDVEALAESQRRLLEALWPLLAPGGRLLYCTCSVFRAEGERQIESFVAHNKEALRMPAPGHLGGGLALVGDAVPDNPPGGTDGFFYALLQRAAP